MGGRRIKRDWWLDEEATDAHVVRLMVDAIDSGRGREWDGYDEFGRAYSPVPVVVYRGEWWVTDSRGARSWETGVTSTEVPGAEGDTATLGDLSEYLRIDISRIAETRGWPMSYWSIEDYAQRFPAVARALKRHERWEARKRKEAMEEERRAREEAEMYDREEREERAQELGEELVYAPPGTTIAQAAELLGMPRDSQTVRLYATGMLDLAEAQRRAEIIAWRHECTDYDDLLDRGVDRETAREIIRDWYY